MQGDLQGGDGASRGLFKLRETLLREKLLPVKLGTGAEAVPALAMR